MERLLARIGVARLADDGHATIAHLHRTDAPPPPPPPPTDLKPEDVTHLVANFPAVSGVGTGVYKGEPLHLEPEPGSREVYQRARSVPFALTTRYAEAVDKNVRRGVWVPIKAAKYATAIVPVPKKNGSLRLRADYRSTVNKALRADLYRMPTVTEVLTKVGEGRWFAEIDLEEAYAQIPVDEPTGMLLAVNTTKGLFRATRLQFGVNVATSVFQRIMDGLLGALEGTLAYVDNVYVWGSTLRQLYDRLCKVLEVLSKAGFKVNDKCVWATQELQVLGFKVTAEGVQPLEDKARAILEAPRPKDVLELRAFNGLVTFYDRFIKDKATIMEPLYRLLDKGTAWTWGKREQAAFDAIKTIIAGPNVLVHYSLDLPLLMTCDASPVGVGAVLAHIVSEDDTAEERPVMVASRTLNAAERNYAQTDQEALAVVFGCKKFAQYLVGRHFTVVTDHKPLLHILDPCRPVPEQVSPRVLRWLFLLAALDYQMLYKPGKDIGHADFLSRCPLPTKDAGAVDPAGIWLLEARDVQDLSAQDIAEATAEDRQLSAVGHWVRNGWPKDVPQDHADINFTPFKGKKDALSCSKGCLLWGDRVVVPSKLRPRVLALLHGTHLGISYSKAIARSIVWWPGFDAVYLWVYNDRSQIEDCQWHQSY
ncbi:hypothetical protein ONE63_003479 [Megalurothrips usitatus]|uniref:RNA-directed DNA polymerase n=1 Tax=Megalurothrips usitatus TaxID=439358 RepID=A0AAV7X7D6_9NEOP|nr:hypothetical protein ONE63_003479 [Megalurothrips usitatus]